MAKKVKLSDLFYVKESKIHGKGLFARCRLEEGDYLGTYKGPEVSLGEREGDHILWVEERKGRWIGRDGRNLLRYINHCEEPCAEFDGFDLYAMETIKPHKEITIHYGDEFVAAITEEE